MVNYAALRRRRSVQKPVDPIEIFRRLPKSERIKDLFDIQRQAIQEWFPRRNTRDFVIKLNTGGGKTLVGLIIAQSIMNEQQGPVLYLCPNWQLVTQTLEKANEVGISAQAYDRRVDVPEFLNGQSIMIAPYQVLFNGRSKFGLRGRSEVVSLEGIILDDAHAALPTMRQQFTLSVSSKKQPELYNELVGVFRRDFAEIRKDGVLNDVVRGDDPTVLEIPYWSWRTKQNAVQQILTNAASQSPEEWKEYVFAWPLLRNDLDVCHALIGAWDFTITSMYPIVDLFPTFVDCPRRIYMSATLSDDSAIIRTFDVSPQHVANPIMPVEMTNVGERMILVPSLTGIAPEEQLKLVKKLALYVAKRAYGGRGAGVVILVPSYAAAREWEDIGTIVLREDIEDHVAKLQSGESKGPYILANRYDGIDLPGDSCRLLILAGLPKGIDSYDTYLGSVLGEGSAIQTTRAQRIEQGAGRSTRGAGDFSVVLFVGSDLAAWVGTFANLDLVTQATRVQFEIGVEISKAITGMDNLIKAVSQCLKRDIGWRTYHAEALAELTESLPVNQAALGIAAAEREFFRLLRLHEFERAVYTLEEALANELTQDKKYIGWLLQLAARAAHFGDLEKKFQQLQERAFKANPTLLLPLRGKTYISLAAPGEQAEMIVKQILAFASPKIHLSQFENIASQLDASVSSNQFEEALKRLGQMLGFRAQRPEREFGRGPDVLWLLDGQTGFVMEAKSKKKTNKPLTKSEHAQLLSSFEWFKAQYPDYEGAKIVVHPNTQAYSTVTPRDTLVLTLNGLSVLVSKVRELLLDLCTSGILDETALSTRCEVRLRELGLKPEDIREEFMEQLRNIQKDQ